MRVDQINFDEFREHVRDALEGLGRRYGLQLKVGKIKYSKENLTAQLIGAVMVNGQAQTPERIAFRNAAHSAGLHPALLDYEFVDGDGDRLKIVGWNTRAKTMPVKLRRLDDNRPMKAGVDWILPYVKDAMNRLAQGQSI